MSSTILGFVLYDMVVRYRIERQLNFFILICFMIILALICTLSSNSGNIVYSFDHELHAFNDFEGALYDAYFGLIVYYVALRLYAYSRPINHKKLIKWVIHITFMVYNGLLFAMLIENLVAYVRCEGNHWDIQRHGTLLQMCWGCWPRLYWSSWGSFTQRRSRRS